MKFLTTLALALTLATVHLSAPAAAHCGSCETTKKASSCCMDGKADSSCSTKKEGQAACAPGSACGTKSEHSHDMKSEAKAPGKPSGESASSCCK